MTYGFLDFIWLLLFGWMIVVVLNVFIGGIVSIFTRGIGKKHLVAGTFKEVP